jgi:hypothetical protein
VSCLKSWCIRSGSASTYWTTTRANCEGLEAGGGQNCRFAGSSGPTATSPCTTPEQKCAIPYNCGCVFGRPSANALQPRNQPSGDWAADVPPNARSTAPKNVGTRVAYVISFSLCCSCLVLYHNPLTSLVERGAWHEQAQGLALVGPTTPAPPTGGPRWI